jgi:adenosylcobinamide-GDP ribazoletransferase
LATGALHEDGLADTADGFGGGNSREQKLAIMRDSRIGTYGVCALALSLVLRVGALASLPSAHAVVWALLAAHAAARATMPALMLLLPPARSDGLSHDAGQPAGAGVAAAAAIGFLVLVFCLPLGRAIVALILLVAIVALMAWLATRQIGGQTGDVLGALEQVGEIAVLLAALG